MGVSEEGVFFSSGGEGAFPVGVDGAGSGDEESLGGDLGEGDGGGAEGLGEGDGGGAGGSGEGGEGSSGAEERARKILSAT